MQMTKILHLGHTPERSSELLARIDEILVEQQLSPEYLWN